MEVSELQDKVRQMYKKNGWDIAPELLLIAMQEELGEIAGRFLAEHPGYKKSVHDQDPIPEEVGDLVTLVLAFCNKQGINFEKWVLNTINKRKNQA